MCLILIGFKKCGKTTLGSFVAKALGFSFFDTDRIVEELYAAPCPEIIEKEGESYFRALEKRAVASLKKDQKSVIATGGGTLVEEANALKLKELGKLIYLKVDFALLEERIVKRPSFLRGSLKDLAEQRFLLYERWADVTIDVDEQSQQTLCDLAREYACE